MSEEQGPADPGEGIVVTGPRGPLVTPTHDRLTLILSGHLEHHQEAAESIGFTGSVNLDHQQQLYGPRRMKVGKTPKPLDLGWIEVPGLVLIENTAGRKRTTHPSAEEITALALELVFLYCKDGGGRLIVRPGRFNLVEFEDARSWLVGAAEDNTPIEISVISQ